MILFKVFESTILDNYLHSKLVELCELPKDKKWELKYRGTRDGLKAADFHTRCDGIAKTLTVVKATSGNIFGGYTEQAWHSKNEWIKDPKAFIFSLVNKEEDPFKANVSNEGIHAIYGSSKYGPVFGKDEKYIRDLCIFNTEETSCSEFGYSYQHGRYPKDTVKANSILAGSTRFQVQEIEIFVKKN
jgi:hypothetical protein